MAKQKSVCLKWTLVLVVLLCPYVYSRPQTSDTSEPYSENVVKTSENPLRYRFRNTNLSFNNINVSVDLGSNTNSKSPKNLRSSNKFTRTLSTVSPVIIKFNREDAINNTKNLERTNRLLRRRVTSPEGNKNRTRVVTSNLTKHGQFSSTHSSKKPTIRKVITKWTDNTKYEDLDLTFEIKHSDELDKITFNNLDSKEDYDPLDTNDNSTESSEKLKGPTNIKEILSKLRKKLKKRPNAQVYTSQERESNLSNPHVTANYAYPTARPVYTFMTPSPTPIITNIGNPKPWSRPNSNPLYHVQMQNPTFKPVNNQFHNHNNYPPYPQEFEVTTFQPTNSHTDRIVIRPEDYSGSPDECPTIYLSLNNTFQGQGKEACPDLNIAVNTNVINKNVVIESDENEEENPDIFPAGFDLPFDEQSEEETFYNNEDLEDSDENEDQSESESIEGLSYTNYNSVPSEETSELAGAGSQNAPITSLQRPSNSNNDDDDSFSLSSWMHFFNPAFSALSWLTSLNPFGFTLISLFLSPLIFLLAGTSSIAALFAPFAFSAREAPKVVHVYRPHWHWDDEIKTWHLHSFPNNRGWTPTRPRSGKAHESTNDSVFKPTLFYEAKELMKSTTELLRDNNKNLQRRTNRRKRREVIWSSRIK